MENKEDEEKQPKIIDPRYLIGRGEHPIIFQRMSTENERQT